VAAGQTLQTHFLASGRCPPRGGQDPVLEEKGHILKADVVVRTTAFEPYFDPINDYSRMLSELTSR
jgi:hypothetical protein